MRTNIVRAVVVCAMAGAAVSCLAPHTLIGPADFPQARTGSKVKFSSSDGGHDICFTNTQNPPCKEGAGLSVKSGNDTPCTVIGKPAAGQPQFYFYAVEPPGFCTPAKTRAPIIPTRALIVKCSACGSKGSNPPVGKWGHKRHGSSAPSGSPAPDVGAIVAVTAAGISVLAQQCTSTSGALFDACALQGQQAQWQTEGESPLTIKFVSSTPSCEEGNPLPSGTTVVCTIGPSATQTDYPYTATLGGATFNGTLTVMAAPR
jgi:hypothetical protein